MVRTTTCSGGCTIGFSVCTAMPSTWHRAATASLVQQQMAHRKFQACIRGLANTTLVSLPLEEAARLTTYSLRRKLPSAADRFQLVGERRSEIGDWRDEVGTSAGARKPKKEPMQLGVRPLPPHAECASQHLLRRFVWARCKMRLSGGSATRASFSKQC